MPLAGVFVAYSAIKNIVIRSVSVIQIRVLTLQNAPVELVFTNLRLEFCMKLIPSLLAATLALASFASFAADGLVSIKSAYSAADTATRLENTIKDKGLTLFARINHSAGAEKIGKKLRPTEVFVFGNPQGGTPLMECAQTAGIDLPLKALVWEDASAQVWLSYNDPAYLAKRHEAANCPVVENLAKALAGIGAAVTSK